MTLLVFNGSIPRSQHHLFSHNICIMRTSGQDVKVAARDHAIEPPVQHVHDRAMILSNMNSNRFIGPLTLSPQSREGSPVFF